MYKIYVDGSVKIKNKKGVENIGGFGYVVYNEQDEIVDAFSKKVKNTTNNRMELLGLYEVIKKYGSESIFGASIVYTDSSYALNCLLNWAPVWERNNWINSKNKPVENQDIIKKMYELYWKDHFIVVEKCKGHNGIEGNELADKLACREITPEEVLERYGKV